MRKGALVTGLVLLIVVLALAQYGILNGGVREGFLNAAQGTGIAFFVVGGIIFLFTIKNAIQEFGVTYSPIGGTYNTKDRINNAAKTLFLGTALSLFAIVPGYLVYSEKV
jgi:hypothetical protein